MKSHIQSQLHQGGITHGVRGSVMLFENFFDILYKFSNSFANALVREAGASFGGGAF